jgi:hypothetical protein
MRQKLNNASKIRIEIKQKLINLGDRNMRLKNMLVATIKHITITNMLRITRYELISVNCNEKFGI